MVFLKNRNAEIEKWKTIGIGSNSPTENYEISTSAGKSGSWQHWKGLRRRRQNGRKKARTFSQKGKIRRRPAFFSIELILVPTEFLPSIEAKMIKQDPVYVKIVQIKHKTAIKMGSSQAKL